MARTKTLRCALCQTSIWKGSTSLPQGQAICQPCRRVRFMPYKSKALTRGCKDCGAPKPSTKHTYCTRCAKARRAHSAPPKLPSAARGYGSAHQRERKKWKPVIANGKGYCHATDCLMDERWIAPWEPWDLGHTRDRSAYTGPEHRKCNRSEGASRGNRRRGLPPQTNSQDW